MAEQPTREAHTRPDRPSRSGLDRLFRTQSWLLDRRRAAVLSSRCRQVGQLQFHHELVADEGGAWRAESFLGARPPAEGGV